MERFEPREPIVRLVSFGAGLPGAERALNRVMHQAQKLNLIDSVVTYSAKDLDLGFHQSFGTITTDFPKGFGLWSWKPYIVDVEMSKLRDGDILIYVDAGVEINPRGIDNLAKYLDIVARKGYLFFSVGLQNRFWTKPDSELISIEHFFRNQVVATVFFIKVSSSAKSFVNSWLTLSKKNRSYLLKDPDSSEVPFNTRFIAHRHDQSILSKLVFDSGIETMEDRTYFKRWRHGFREPFLAIRNKQTGFSWLNAAFWLPKPMFKMWQIVSMMLTPEVLMAKVREKLSHQAISPKARISKE
jgi:hypothetical protein